MPVDYRSMARAVADSVGIDPDLFERQIMAESNFNPDSVSPAGAIGLGQLMPSTAKDLGVDPTDPRQNLIGAATYMKRLLARFGGDPRLALAGYNAGPGRVEAAGNQVPSIPETTYYVDKIAGPAAPTAAPEDFAAALFDRMRGIGQDSATNLSDIANLRSKADAQAMATAHQYLNEASAPLPTTNPDSDLISRTLGSIADVLTGGQGGRKMSEDTIAQEHGNMLTARLSRLKALADAADKAADRASKLGDTEAELKYRTSADKANRDAQATIEAFREHSMTQREAARQAAEDKRAAARNTSEQQQEETRAKSNERVARIQKGLNPDTNEPMTLNPSSWPSVKDQALVDDKLRDQARKKNGGYDAKRYKAGLISSYMPNKSENMQAFINGLVNKRDPNNPTKFLFNPDVVTGPDGKPARKFNDEDLRSIKAIVSRWYMSPEDQQAIAGWDGVLSQ